MPTYVDTFRATIAPADCDHLGHMNVQHYFRAVSDGMFAVMVRIGLPPEEIRRRELSFAVVRAETDFHRELHAGDVIALESTILRVGEKSAIFHHRLRNEATHEIAMSTEFKCVLLDLVNRQAAVVPDDIRNSIAHSFPERGET
jgi:acyl-CoA thioester hydrolase